MLRQTLPMFALAALLAAGAAHADHNSPFGEGWANMPNDAHDDAVDRVTDELRSDMAAQVEDFEDIRSGMTDELRGAMEDATEARAEMSEMAEDMRGAGMGR